MGMYRAAEAVKKADIMIIIGTSLKVYPAAVLVYFATRDCRVFLIDPEPIHLSIPKYEHIQKTASEGMSDILDLILHN
jgi:NAD-dependent deacetylase